MKIQKSHIFGVVLGLIPIMIIYFAYAIPPTFYDYANQTCCLKINTIKIKNLTANLRVF